MVASVRCFALFGALAALAGCAARLGDTEPSIAADASLGSYTAIAGIVRGPDGQPMPRATVWLAREDGHGTESTMSASAGADGAYRFERLEPGQYRVWSQTLADYQLLTEERDVELSAGERMRLNLAFASWTKLDGRVRFGGGDPPVQGFRVDLVSDAGEQFQLRLDETGTYSTWIRPGTYRVAVMSGLFGLRFLPETATVPRQPQAKLDVAIPTGEATVNLVVPAGEEFTQGTLTAEYLTHGNSLTSRIAMTSPRVRLDRLVPGEYAVGIVMDNGLQGESGKFAVREGAPSDVKIILERPRPRTFAGKIKLPPGKYEYKFFAPADTWQDDILNPQKSGAGVMANAILNIPGGSAYEDGKRSTWPRVYDSSGEAEFWVSLPTLKDAVYVRGTFNNWRVEEQFRLERVPEREFELTATIPPGEHEYKIYSTDDVWSLDPSNPNTKGDALEINNTLTVADGAGPVTFRCPVATRTGEVYVRGSFTNWEALPEFRMKEK